MQANQVDYLHGKLFPMILRFSIPAAISLLITAIYNIVDRMFVGNVNGTSALAGLSVCFPLSYMMMAFELMCSAGGATFFSLLSGQGETKRMHKAFGNAFVLVCGWEILLTVFLLVLADPLLVLFGVTDTAYPYAIAYYRIVALGCLFQGLSQLFCDFVRVSGKPVLGMCVTGIGAVTNIILDAVFIEGLDWGVVGAATLSDFAILKALAADGLGVSFLYEAAVARELAGGRLARFDLAGIPLHGAFYFVCLKDNLFARSWMDWLP